MADSAGIRAGRAFVELGANDAQLRAAVDRASARLQAFGASVAAAGRQMAVLGVAGLAGLGAAAGTYANVGEQLYRMSQRTGASVEALSALRYAAAQTGTDLETVEGAMRSVQQALVQAAQGSADAQDKFLMLGLRARQLKNLNTDSQFLIIAEQLSKIRNPALQAARTMEIFGSTALLPMIKDGARGLAQFRNQAQALGITMGTQTAKSAMELAQAWQRIRMTGQSLAIVVGSSLAPALRMIADLLTPSIASVGRWIDQNRSAVVAIGALTAGVTALGISLMVTGTAIRLAGTSLLLLNVPSRALLGTLGAIGAAGKLGLAALSAGFLMAKASALGLLAVLSSPLLLKGALIGGAVALGAAALSRTPTMGAGSTSGSPVPSLGAEKQQREAGVIQQSLTMISQAATTTWSNVRSTGTEAWASVSTTAVEAWQGISAAIEAGDLGLAVQIATAGVNLEWTKLVGYLTEKWYSFTDVFSDAGDMLQEAWVNVTTFLVGDWDKFTSGIKGAWDATVSAFESSINWLKELFAGLGEKVKQIADYFGIVIDKAAVLDFAKGAALGTAKGMLTPITWQFDLASLLTGSSTATDEEIAKTKKKRMDAIKEEADEKKRLRDEERAKAEADANERVRKAREAFQKARELASKAMQEQQQKKEEQAKKVDSAAAPLDAINRKVDVKGTFSGAAAGLLGGGSVQERIAQNGINQLKELKDIKRVIQDNGLGMAVS